MAYAGVQMFMQKLKQLINCRKTRLINNWTIRCKRSQFQLLYQELDSMIQTLSIQEHQDQHELESVNDLKKRFTYAAEEAEYIVDLFLSDVHKRNHDDATRSFKFLVDLFLSCVHIGSGDLKRSLEDVRRSLKSVEAEFMSMRVNNKKMDSSRTTLVQPAPAQNFVTRSSLGSKKLLDEIIVGIDRDVELIRDKLVEDQKKLEVVSIVGMGGIGKTTLANKVFNDAYVKHHFYVRVWVTVSQTYDKREVLIQILESIRGQLNLENDTDSRLREMVHKHLMGKRYLIVIDDIWHIETWDNLKIFFPHDNTGSRILLTSRVTEVATHANSDGLIHHLGHLNKESSWELLRQKVFHCNECPEWSVKHGMQIVENCQGLPLAVVVIAGVLAKEAWNENFWVEIACKTGSYIVGDQNGCLETLGLSYNHLPPHLRKCFLYLGGFPEDYKFKIRWLVLLWVAEGFIQQDGDRSLEDIAEGYLTDLIDRNLVVADRRKFNGGVKSCKLHDLVRELCLRKAKEEQVSIQTEELKSSSQLFDIIRPQSKQPLHLFINKDTYDPDFSHPSARNLRSILCFSNFRSLSDDIAKYPRCFALLRVLDLRKCELNDFPEGLGLLVHLRYLALRLSSQHFPSSICTLWNLQTLVYITEQPGPVFVPSNITYLVNLKHMKSLKGFFYFHLVQKPMNLQTISGVELSADLTYHKVFPNIKELACSFYFVKEDDIKCIENLTCLEKLKLTGSDRRLKSTVNDSPKDEPKNRITFPATLKTLTLQNCGLEWSDMSTIHSLPSLQILKLHYKAISGSCWNTEEQEFRQLKFLRLEMLDIELWEAYHPSFPCLKQLEILGCKNLQEIPLEIGDIPTLELIKIENCGHSCVESVRRIEEEQHDLGNYDLKINILEDIGSSQFSER